MDKFLKKILDHFNLNEDEYIELTKDIDSINLPSPLSFNNIEKAKDFLINHIKNNTKTLIYGDYDCDGIMSTSIMYLTLEKLGLKAGYYIPFREKDGYGLTIENIDRFYKLGYKLFILVDNGISLNKEIDYLNSLGLESIIIDHHSLKEEVPKANFIIHPFFSDLKEFNLSAGAVSFYFSQLLLNEIDPYLLTLASISLISDLMPILSYNRDLVRLGLYYLNKYKFYNIISLINKESDFDEESISLQVAPKINAVGRIITGNKLFNIVKLFIVQDIDKINQIAKWVNLVNEERKEIVNNTEIDTSTINENFIIQVLDTKEGLTGLIANRLLTQFNKPTMILVKSSDNDILKGSIRCKNGLNLIELFEKVKDKLISYGGHELAGGISFYQKDLNDIKNIFNDFAKTHPFKENLLEKNIKIELSDINSSNYQILSTFKPFGQGFNKPNFELNDIVTSTLKYSKDLKHIITPLSMTSSIVYFNYDKELLKNSKISFIGNLEDNLFNNQHKTQFRVIKYVKKS